MPLKSNNIELMTYDNVNEVIKEIFESLRSRYQTELETSMIGSDFKFEGVSLLYHKCHKRNFKRGGSYFDSPE